MSKLSKVLIAVVAIAGVVVVGIVLSRRPGKGPESDLQVSVSEPTSSRPGGDQSFLLLHQTRAAAAVSKPGQ